MTPWLHRPQKRSLPSPIYLMLILSLTLIFTTPPHAAPPTPAAHTAPQIAPPHTPLPTPAAHTAPQIAPPHTPLPTTAAHPAPPTTPPHAAPQIKSPPVILPSSPVTLTPSPVILSEAKNLNPLHPPQPLPPLKSPHAQTSPTLADLEGTWEIQEEERTYVATLDAHGNGPYTHEGGTFTTTTLEGRRWSGKWSQTGNDREGEFEVLLSEDGLTAEGRWWYTRVGTFTHIPARVYGGTYLFKRQSPKTDSPGQPP